MQDKEVKNLARPGPKPQVLVVDDNVANRAAFKILLETDYTVVLAESGPQALDLSLREEFAVILLDVRMPVMDGFETAALLRQRERTHHTPIIFMSAFDQSVFQIKKGYVAGATEFLSSPVDEELLLFKVGAYAKLHHRNESMRRQIYHLNRMIEAIKVEANLRANLRETAFKAKMDELGATIADLNKEISIVP